MGEDFGRIMTWPFSDYFFPEEDTSDTSSGGGGIDTSKASSSVSESEKKAKAVRNALYKTAGGSSGEALLSSQTQRRATLLGN